MKKLDTILQTVATPGFPQCWVTITCKQKDAPSSSTIKTDIWKKVWAGYVPPKMKNFAWRALHNALPVSRNLAQRKMDVDCVCKRCGKGEENVTHLLLECREVKRMWYVSPLRLIVECREGESFRDWVEKMLKQNCWGGGGLLKGYGRGQFVSRVGEQWKCFGAIVRDEMGDVLVAMTDVVKGEFSVEICEALAVRRGLQIAIKAGFKALVVESDCLCVVEAIRRKRKHHSHLGLILNDIFALMEMCSPVSMSHVRRTGNGAAHSLVKMSFEWGELRVWLEDAPHQEEEDSIGGPCGLGGGCLSLRHTTLVCASTIGLLRVCDSAHEATPDTRLAVADLPPLPLIEMRD
ncbi:hypothetical protein RDABS01_020197 [Bienertia sinuspersici]